LIRYEAGKNSRVYVVWYVVGVMEMALHLGFSQLSEVLTFVGTHMGERLNLLTLIVLGEGIVLHTHCYKHPDKGLGAIILAKNVTLVVKDTYLKDANLNVWSVYMTAP
jgi:low temperature requirement protein LtrA